MYRYYCPMRPPALGGIPSGTGVICYYGEQRYVDAIGCTAWGYVEYARPLTPKEVYDYELVLAPGE